MSKARKQSREKFEAAEIFSDEDFDADNFVEQMDDRSFHHKSGPRSGWRRLEQLREEQQLREELQDIADWDDFDGTGC